MKNSLFLWERGRGCGAIFVSNPMSKTFDQSHADRDVYQRQIESTDAQIDALVYALYDLTAQEIAIVQASAA